MISGTVPTPNDRIRVYLREGFEDPGGWLVYTKDGVLQPASVAQVEGESDWNRFLYGQSLPEPGA